jgi:hypothetical protein
LRWRHERVAALGREQVVHDDPRHRCARLDGRARDVRRQHHVREIEQRLRHLRLVHEHVEAGREPARHELELERVLVDDGAAGRVHDCCPVTHECESLRGEQARRLGRQRHVERDRVGLPQQLVELAIFDQLRLDATPLRVEHAHLEAAGAPRDRAADPSEADDSERGARHLAAEERARRPGRAPAAGAHQPVALDEAPPRREQ